VPIRARSTRRAALSFPAEPRSECRVNSTVATSAQVIHQSFDGPGFFGSHTEKRMISTLIAFRTDRVQ